MSESLVVRFFGGPCDGEIRAVIPRPGMYVEVAVAPRLGVTVDIDPSAPTVPILRRRYDLRKVAAKAEPGRGLSALPLEWTVGILRDPLEQRELAEHRCVGGLRAIAWMADPGTAR